MGFSFSTFMVSSRTLMEMVKLPFSYFSAATLLYLIIFLELIRPSSGTFFPPSHTFNFMISNTNE